MMDWVKGFLALWVVLHAGTPAYAEEGGEKLALSKDGETVVTLDPATPQETVQRIKEGALVVDVRSPEEFQSGHLEGAVNIPHTSIAQNIAQFGADKGRNIVVYCRSGRRSGLALTELVALGFTNVINGGAYKDIVAAQ
jgi:phage shock protein E